MTGIRIEKESGLKREAALFFFLYISVFFDKLTILGIL